MAIKIVELKRAPVVRAGKLEIAGKVTSAQLASLEINARDRLSQNEARRAAGAELAGQFMAK